MRNPPAFDKILIEQYDVLKGVVPPKWLPEPIYVASEAAKKAEQAQKRLDAAIEYDASFDQNGAYLKVVREEVEKLIGQLQKKPKQRKSFKEYGTGHYGAVYPTQMPGIVCKITTDKSEAQFVANAISIGKWPEGIVKYYAIFQFKQRTHKRRPVYILWRDEAHPPQLADSSEHDETHFIKLVHNTKDIAHWVRMMLLRGKREIPEDYPDYMQFDINRFTHARGAEQWINSFSRFTPVKYKLAAGMEALRWAMRDQLDWSYSFNPGGAMWFYLEHGMLLADVHANNIMRGEDGWVISDPGHMIELDNRYNNVKIPEI